jgi:hypothetical protein
MLIPKTYKDLEEFEYITSKGYFRKRNSKSSLFELFLICNCKKCGDEFLAFKKNVKKGIGIYCSYSCSRNGYKHTEETKDKLRYKKTKDHCLKISKGKKGKSYLSNSGDNCNFWKGGYRLNNIPAFDVYKNQIDQYEEVKRSSIDENILEVRCTYCNKWYIPKRTSVRSRIQNIKGNINYRSENRFYCSDECKGNCDLFNQKLFPKSFLNPRSITREVQPQLRKMVLERDNWTCQKCNEVSNLHCHHIDPVINNPI